MIELGGHSNRRKADKEWVIRKSVFEIIALALMCAFFALVLLTVQYHFKNTILTAEIAQYTEYVEQQKQQLTKVSRYEKDLAAVNERLQEAERKMEALKEIEQTYSASQVAATITGP